ncbi:4-hydroxybenzoate octaprenyltransferase, partial [Gammaproteobacteria bacterium]|nr:4-hydroxybenzoate octaprenyltransferase [Gammaproteobacteria bacterium]
MSPLRRFQSKLPALLKLMRVDRPIGILLLLWPTLGALW